MRGQGFDPWSRKISHATGQLSHVTQQLSLLSRARASQQEKPSQWEARALQLESSRESLCTAAKIQHSENK